MKVFLSWSGSTSRIIAQALAEWLPRVIQAIRPFFSPEIEKGAKWSSEIDSALEGTNFGIVCLTRDNLSSEWIHYEAGALSKTPNARILTLLVGIKPGDVGQPLGKFQATLAEKDDVLELVKTLNGLLNENGGTSLPTSFLIENFEVWWPQLEQKIASATTAANPPGRSVAKKELGSTEVNVRDERAVLEEILELSRAQERRLSRLERKFETSTIRPNQARKRPAFTTLLVRSKESLELTERLREAVSEQLPVADSVIRNDDEQLTVKWTMAIPIYEDVLTNALFEAAKLTDFQLDNWTAA